MKNCFRLFMLTVLILGGSFSQSYAQNQVNIMQLYADRQRLLVDAQYCSQDGDCTVLYNQSLEDDQCYTPVNRHNDIDELMSVARDFRRVDPRKANCKTTQQYRARCLNYRCFLREKFPQEPNVVKEGNSQLVYNNNGTILKEVMFDNETLDGRTIEYNHVGLKRKETHFFNNKKQGPEIIYDNNGIVKSRKEYFDGKPHGKHENFFADGKIQSRETYENGSKVSSMTYNQQGVLRTEYHWNNGNPCERAYDINGKLTYEDPGCL